MVERDLPDMLGNMVSSLGAAVGSFMILGKIPNFS